MSGRWGVKNVMCDPALALIAARPGPLLEGLRCLISALPRIKIVGAASDVASLLRMMSERSPDLVLLDAALVGDEDGSLVRQVKTRQPEARFVVLTDTVGQQSAQADTADVVLLKGVPAARLVEAIEGVLAEDG
jgi:DNA-binding NarL/FixJ family response regulator